MNASWTQRDLERLIKLLKEGWTEEMIAIALSRKVEEIRRKIRELQIKPVSRSAATE